MVFEVFGTRDPLSVVRVGLCEEFADTFDPAFIERVAAEEVAAFEDARVRDFIPILAMRRGRARLRGSAPSGIESWTHV